MDTACEDYVKIGWCFVAVKTKVGSKQGIDPKPGMRNVNTGLPDGASFDGNVQAMGFRFKTKRLVVPMRLSTFNEGDLHNIVYVLTDEPQQIRSVPEEYVVRQISGDDLFKNVTQPLPLRIIGGTAKDLQPWQKKNLPQQRNPVPHNGAARDLFAADLLAVSSGQLSHPHEEKEKMLLRIGESLGLRGADIDSLNEAALKDEREKIVAKSLKDSEGHDAVGHRRQFPARSAGEPEPRRSPPSACPPAATVRDSTTRTPRSPAARRQGIRVERTISFDDDPKTEAAGKLAATPSIAVGRPAAWPSHCR